MTTTRQIAHDQLLYLEMHPDVCAEGNANGWRKLRYADGEWRAVKVAHGERSRDYIKGRVLSEAEALDWLERKPTTLVPVDESHRFSETSMWEAADDQDVFTERHRCWYCGASERTERLMNYETTDDGACLLCSDCHDSFEQAGQIEMRIGPPEDPT